MAAGTAGQTTSC